VISLGSVSLGLTSLGAAHPSRWLADHPVMGALLIAVAGGVITEIGRATINWARRQRQYRLDFAHLGGRYQISRKLAVQAEPETASITAHGNILHVTFEGLPKGDSVEGKITMKDHASGKGDYVHLKDGQQLWGSWEIHVQEPETILVHRTYASHKTHAPVVSGYVWNRIGPPRDESAGDVSAMVIGNHREARSS
jgi:hypothetical protein